MLLFKARKEGFLQGCLRVYRGHSNCFYSDGEGLGSDPDILGRWEFITNGLGAHLKSEDSAKTLSEFLLKPGQGGQIPLGDAKL